MLIIIWLIFSARKWPLPSTITKLQCRVAIILLGLVFPLNVWIYPQMGFLRPWPMHLCDWAAFTSILALISRRQIFVELTYFWALAGATNALITPDVSEGIPHPRFVVFFVHHIGVVAVALWMTVGMKYYPRKHAVWRVFAWSQLYLASAMIVNHFTGHNYGFLAHKPKEAAGTLLDFLGPWPWYILSLELVCLLFFLVLNLPWVWRRKLVDPEKP